MNRRLLSVIFILLFIFCFAEHLKAKASQQHAKNENKESVTIYVFDKKGNNLAAEKGLIDSKGVVSTKCKIVLKWFEEVENTLIVKANDGSAFQLGKILFCNIKKDHTLFLLEPLDAEKNFLINTAKPTSDIKIPPPTIEKIDPPASLINTDNVQDLFQGGLRHQELKDYNTAFAYYKRALMLKPDFAEAHINLGSVYFITGRYNEAIEAYNNALQHSQENVAAVLNKVGTSYLMLGDYSKAIETYKQVLSLKSDGSKTRFSLGLAYFMNGNNEEAFNEYISLNKIDEQLAENLFDLLYR